MRQRDQLGLIGMLEGVVIASHPIKHPSVAFEHLYELSTVTFQTSPRLVGSVINDVYLNKFSLAAGQLQ
jgi:hypothetical protein